MGPCRLEEGSGFSLLRVEGFAVERAHGFAVRSGGGGPLFRPGPVAREALCRRLGRPTATLHLARQVHGAEVRIIEGRDAPGAEGRPPEEADALVSRLPGRAVAVVTADCLPILLSSEGAGVAAVHAGWRGLLAGVIEAAAGLLGPPSEIEAAIGPAIGACCFEVGPEVSEAFERRFAGGAGLVFPTATDPGKSRVDLPAAATRALRELGLRRSRIHDCGLCTRCGGERFESFRRDGLRAGRMIALIAI